MQAKSKGELRLLQLPTKAKIAHKMLVAQKLFLLGVQADNNMVSIPNTHKIVTYKEDAV